MSTKKRLLAFCVAVLTIPAFTVGGAPYEVVDISDTAYAFSEEKEIVPETNLEYEDVTWMNFNFEEIAGATKECRAEEITTCTQTTTTTFVTTTTTATTTVQEAQTTVQTEVTAVNADAIAELSKTLAETIMKEEETVTEETTMPETEVVEEAVPETELVGEAEAEMTNEFVWNGPYLNTRDGIVKASQSPSGYKETFYNLSMYGCLDLLGYSYDGYAVRDDGVKTYNGYVMVASPNLQAYPKGSLIPTTLGMGIVVDYCPAGNLDVAVTW